MRLLKVPLVLCVVFVLFAPSRAHAWFALLDYLSGPGKLYGAVLDVRIACFGQPFSATDTLEAALLNASVKSISATLKEGGVAEAATAWKTFADAVDAAQQRLPVALAGDIDALKNRIGLFERGDYQQFTREVARLGDQAGLATPASGVPPPAPTGDVAAAIGRGQALIGQFYRANVSINSTGVIASLCTPSKTRRLGVEMGVDFFQANSNTRFADDHSIRLVTAMPSLTYRVFTNPGHDILDIGTGAGMYWFSSRGFEAFNGLVLQPVRVDVHGPTQWINSHDLARLFSLLTFRFTFTRFPAGFKAGAFGPGTEAIPAEWTKTAAFYFDIMPFLRRPKHVFGIE